MDAKTVSSKFAFGLEEGIIVFLILLNLISFFELIPDYLDFFKKIIDWTLMGYLVYKVSLTNIFFGKRSRKIDIFLIIAYLFLMFKSLLNWAHTAYSAEASQLIRELSLFFLNNEGFLSILSFLIGSLILVFLAFYSCLFLQFRAPSIIEILHSRGYVKKDLKSVVSRFFKVLIIFFGFFVIVFNLLFEWIAIVVDSSLAVIAIIIYVFFFIRYSKRFNTNTFIYKVGEFGETFYENVISQFRRRSTLLLGISGMLVLHLLTDFGIFIIPYLVKFKDVFYFHALNGSHSPIFSLILQDIANRNVADIILILLIHIFNIISIILLLIIPALLWYFIYSGKILRIKRWYLTLFFITISAFILMPSFSIIEINNPGVVGVDIQSQSIFSSNFAFNSLFKLDLTIFFCFFLGLLALIFSHFEKIEKALTLILIAFSQYFFGYYIYHYFLNIFQYHIAIIKTFLTTTSIYFGLLFILLLLIQIFFYVGGFIIFQYEIIKKLKKYIVF